MLFQAGVVLSGLLLLWPVQIDSSAKTPSAAAVAAYTPTYVTDGKLLLPTRYREWIFLSSGLDMSYSPAPSGMGHSVFDNIFVNPEAYRVFVETGAWPDQTVFVMESRMAQGKGSINRQGHYQGNGLMGLEVHLKDEARFPGKWAFFVFDNLGKGDLMPATADCYSCHQKHGAVDTTFVQFYPTLFNIAKDKGKLSAEYLKESAAANKKP